MVIISVLFMSCTWCEEDVNELIKYCKFEDHRVCVLCYQKYRERYPERVEGCPYCKGTEEKFVVYVRASVQDTMNIHRIYSETAFVCVCLISVTAIFYVVLFAVFYGVFYS